MLGKYSIALSLLIVFVAVVSTAAIAESASVSYDPCTGTRMDAWPKAISKVKPPETFPTKVKPAPPPFSDLTAQWGEMPRFGDLSRLNPMSWGFDCCLPTPAHGQFFVGPKLFFARVTGEARRDLVTTFGGTSIVDFQDSLGFRNNGNLVWSIDALYQFRPRWGIHYSFSPMSLDATGTARSGFTFGGQTFASGSLVRSRWDRYEHRAGIVFNVRRAPNMVTSIYADWLHIDDKLVVGGATTGTVPVAWNSDKNAAIVGLEFNKCLKNFRGNTLALDCKGGVAFLDDTMGYEAEGALRYMIPIRTGRFGFVKGGYRYFTLKKEKDLEMFNSTLSGAFLQIGLLF